MLTKPTYPDFPTREKLIARGRRSVSDQELRALTPFLAVMSKQDMRYTANSRVSFLRTVSYERDEHLSETLGKYDQAIHSRLLSKRFVKSRARDHAMAKVALEQVSKELKTAYTQVSDDVKPEESEQYRQLLRGISSKVIDSSYPEDEQVIVDEFAAMILIADRFSGEDVSYPAAKVAGELVRYPRLFRNLREHYQALDV